MANIHDHEVQREMSYETGRAVGFLEAAIRILDDRRLDLRARFNIASILMWRGLTSPKFLQAAAAEGEGDLDEPWAEATAAEVVKLREDLVHRLNECVSEFNDHFTAG